MKILLINPPRRSELVGKNPSIIEKHRGFNPPLGLLYLTTAIKQFTDYDIEILDTQPLNWTYSQLENHLKGKAVDVVGITAMTFTLVDVSKTVRLIRQILPKAKIVLGGPHIHLFPSETLNLKGVDFALMGEAEYSFVKFLKNIENTNEYPNIPGLVYKGKEDQIIRNDFIPLNNLDEIPFPKRDLLDVKSYNSLLSRGVLSTIIISSRGCPFQCAFCDRPRSPVTSCFRFRSAKNVVDELCECLELGIKDFLFYDDTFTVNRGRVLDVCEEIRARKLNIRWDMRTRVDTVDEEMLKCLKRAGCMAIHYGVESGNDKILKEIKKGFTLQKVKETFKLTQKIGIETLAYFMIGLPSEDRNDIQDSFNLAKELKPHYAHFTIFSPYPGTELYDRGLEKGIIKEKDVWKKFSEDPTEEFKIPVWEENFSRDELYEMIVKFYKRFYLRPSYILSRMLEVRSRDEFSRKARAGLSVFRMKKDNVDTLK